MRALIAVLLMAALSGCAPAVTVRAPVLEMPPIPPRLMEPCETPSPLVRGNLEDLYITMLEDAGRWGRCVRNHDALVEIVKYRDSVMQSWKAQQAAPKSGWRWPWE